MEKSELVVHDFLGLSAPIGGSGGAESELFLDSNPNLDASSSIHTHVTNLPFSASSAAPSPSFNMYTATADASAANTTTSPCSMMINSFPIAGLFRQSSSSSSSRTTTSDADPILISSRREDSPSAADNYICGQLTIFYGGLVRVYDNVSTSKAHEIMMMAAATDVDVVDHIPGVPASALPQARKASLTRFLERRNERLHSRAPYLLLHKMKKLWQQAPA